MTQHPRKRPLLLLWGFMAAGKSTVGRALAEKTKVPFIDLDARIEERAGKSVNALFEEKGEPGFRALEAEALREVLTRCERGVVALGGGALLDETLRAEAMNHGYVVTLLVEIDEVLARTTHDRSRPLLNQPDPRTAAAALLEARADAYQSVHDTIPTQNQSKNALIEQMLNMWQGYES